MQDVRYTLRRLRREPGFAFAAVLIIGLAVGCNTAIFSVVNTLLFQPLQFHDSGRLVWIANARIGNDGGLSSVTSRVANYQDWSQFNHSFEGLTAYFAFFDYGTYTMTGAGEPEQLVGAGVVQNFLDFLGVNPVLGRNFTPQECMTLQAPALILTHGLWVRRFASDPQIIGKTISLKRSNANHRGSLARQLRFQLYLHSRIAGGYALAVSPDTRHRSLGEHAGGDRPPQTRCHPAKCAGRVRPH
jgi:hypothetical protein